MTSLESTNARIDYLHDLLKNTRDNIAALQNVCEAFRSDLTQLGNRVNQMEDNKNDWECDFVVGDSRNIMQEHKCKSRKGHKGNHLFDFDGVPF